jgi:hypothetical protein
VNLSKRGASVNPFGESGLSRPLEATSGFEPLYEALQASA